MALSAHDRLALLDVARAAISAELEGCEFSVDVPTYPAALQRHGASFVTLSVGDELQGCIGTLEPYCALVADVANNARTAAFRDSRFAPLVREQLAALHIHVSVLSRAQPMRFSSEADLLRQLRPGIDGLVLSESSHRATFLPEVWRSLPEPRDFLCQLKRKAGLMPDYWSRTIAVSRYTAESIE